MSPELPQVTVHQCNKWTVNEIQNADIECDSITADRMNILKEITTKQNIYSYTNFLCLLLFPTMSMSMTYLSHFTTPHINSHALHMNAPHTHTHTHTPLKTKNLKWLNASLNPQAVIIAKTPHHRWQEIRLHCIIVTPIFHSPTCVSLLSWFPFRCFGFSLFPSPDSPRLPGNTHKAFCIPRLECNAHPVAAAWIVTACAGLLAFSFSGQ